MVLCRTRAALVLGSCCLLVTFGTPSAHAAPIVFGRPTQPAAGGLESVAINAKGEALALWVGKAGVRVARRDARGRWHHSAALGRGRACSTNFKATIGARGDAVVAWTDGCIEGPTPRLRVATRRAGHHWAKTRTIARTWGSVGLGMTSRGEATLGWGTARGAALVTWGAHGWSAPIRIGTEDGYPLSFALDVRASGRAVAAWSSGRQLIVSRRARTGGWTPPETVPVTPLFSTETPIELGSDRDGRIIVAGAADVDAAFAVETIDYQPAGGWSAPRLVAVSEVPARPSLAMNDRGDAVLGWAQWMHGHTVVLTAARTPTSDWSAPEPRSSDRPERSAWVIKTGISRGDELFAIWTNSGSPGRSADVQAATGTLATGWRAPFRATSAALEPQLAVADGPHAIVGWTQPAPARVTVAVTK